MRIAYLVSQYPAVSHTFIRREVEALRARGLDVQTFSVRPPRDLRSEADRAEAARTWCILPAPPLGVLVAVARAALVRPRAFARTLRAALSHRLAGLRGLVWGGFHFVEALRLARELERRGVDRLHNHFSNSGAAVGLLAARYLGLPWSLTLHGSADFESPTRPLLGAKVEAAEFVACASQYARAQAMAETDPSSWRKLHVVRCGLELAKLPEPARGPHRDGPVRLLCVGRLVPVKAHVGLLIAFEALCARGVEARLRILGEGPERARLEHELERRGLGDRCELPGSVPEHQVLRELEDADVFVLSSLHEGLPVVLIEALALGVPAVAPALAGIPELVRDGDTGRLFPPGDWEALADRVAELASSPRERRRLGELGRARVLAEFDLERAAARLAECFAGAG